MSLAVLVQRRGFWIAAHAHGAEFVDDCAALRYASGGLLFERVAGTGAALLGVSPCAADYSSACGLDDGAESLLHIRRHSGFVLAPLPVKTQNGNAPLIFYFRVEFAEAVSALGIISPRPLNPMNVP